jgi:hypothetical protein
MLGLGLGVDRGGFVPSLPLLDVYGGAAAAYSLRKLRTAYTGAAIRVRESATNTEADIGFNSDGTLNTTALLAHVGANNGFVVTWYDQAGSNNATQASAAAQPQIVSSGSVILENGKAALQFDGSDDGLHTAYSGISGEDVPFSVFSLVKTNTGTGNQTFVSLNNSSNFNPVTTLLLLSGQYGYFFRDVITATKSNTSAQLHNQINLNLICEGTTTSIYYNSTKIINSGDTDLLSIPRDRISIGTFREFTPTNFLNGIIQEAIIYPSDQSTNRAAIESNINAYYNIY